MSHAGQAATIRYLQYWTDQRPTGNNEGIGETRKAELKGSCAALGVEETRCVALDRPEIQDNPRVWWDESLIESIVKEYVQRWHVDVVSSRQSLFHFGRAHA